MGEVITASRQEWLIQSFSDELTELNSFSTISVEKRGEEFALDKDDEHGIASYNSQIEVKASVLQSRSEREQRLIIMMKEIPYWNFLCPQCDTPADIHRVRSSASMLCITCQKAIERKKKGERRG